MNGAHPDSAELQLHADGEPQDGRVARHIESCATCREEVAGIRRVTTALALGSRPSDSLLGRIQSKRADAGRAPPVPARRPSFRPREYALPLGLAAAAALLVFAPRAWRDDGRVNDPGQVGAKGAVPGVVFETVLTGWRRAAVDSVVRMLENGDLEVELRHNPDREWQRAVRLSDRIAGYLVDQGISRSRIDVRREAPQAPGRELAAGAVGITVRAP
ncbi:MAG TPA: hypothetical protein VMY38_02410 [Gemmatimonadaceae bacterium]|nr:hypothetical protein [Gemmatimonadaceae bacterium]